MNDFLPINNHYPAALAQAFAAWERRLRGWQIYDYAVNLEPLFSSIKPETNPTNPTRDDARVAGILERFVGSNRRFG